MAIAGERARHHAKHTMDDVICGIHDAMFHKMATVDPTTQTEQHVTLLVGWCPSSCPSLPGLAAFTISSHDSRTFRLLMLSFWFFVVVVDVGSALSVLF